MFITWEDRKNSGRLDTHRLTTKPAFSFEYAWFVVNDETAQYVESHEYGYWNTDMTDEQRAEVVAWYDAFEVPAAVVQQAEPIELTAEELLERAKSEKEFEIRDQSYTEELQSVADADGNVWVGGYESASRLGLKVLLAEQNEETAVTLFTEAKLPVELTIDEAKSVVKLVSDTYEALFAKRNALLVMLSNAATLEEVEAISWEV
jgi:hypothetical protein